MVEKKVLEKEILKGSLILKLLIEKLLPLKFGGPFYNIGRNPQRGLDLDQVINRKMAYYSRCMSECRRQQVLCMEETER